MKWITEITLNNYRAFAKPETIAIPNKHHLLIYGENGSGKSSIYNGVKDFFNSSFSDFSTDYALNVFEKARGNTNGAITLQITTEDANGTTNKENFVFNEPSVLSTNKMQEIQLANKLKGFLDYKQILKLHSIEVLANQQPNIFNFLVKDLLANHRIANLGGGATSVELKAEYNRISQIINNKRRDSKIYEISINELNRLDSELQDLLRKVFTEANRFLSAYFKNKITLDINYTNLNVIGSKHIVEKISLRVFYAGREINNYHIFLNEARLSAIAICLYLASIKTNPLPTDILRVLYLDDVFIGLDMSNRIPLLEIIKEEFIINDFQLFLSTYDRQWFQLAYQWFENNKCRLKCVELFIEDEGDLAKPEYPVLIADRSDYFESAKSYFASKDYPAAANYLRKACEAELRRILPSNKKLLANNSTGEIIKIENLDALINNFDEFIQKNNLDNSPFQHFKTYKKIVFNPLSHDDLESPHYRKELQDGICLVENLRKIKTKEIAVAKDGALKAWKLGVYDKASTIIHHYEIILLENLQLIQQDTSFAKLSLVECIIIENNKNQSFSTLHSAFDQILIERNYPPTTNYDEFYKNVSVNSHKKLIDLMVF